MTAIAGIMAQAWGLAEATLDTPLAFAATDAFDFMEMSFTPNLDFSKLVSHVGTGSLQGEVEEKRGGEWSAKIYVAPTSLGVAPDAGFLLEHSLGQETVSGGASVTYSLLDVAPSGLQLTRRITDGLLEQINGAWIEQMQFEITGGDEPFIAVSGGFASYAMLMQGATVLGAEATAQTDIELASGDARLVRPNAYIKFTGDDGTAGAGYLVTAVDYDTDIITISPGIVGSGLSGGESLLPNVPGQTLAGTVVGGISCGMSLGGTTLGGISLKTTFDTGIRALSNEATANRPNRLVRGPRTIEGTLDAYYLGESAPFIGGAWNGNLLAIIQRAGADTAAARMKINTPNSRLGVIGEFDLPDDDAAGVTIPFVARQNAAAKDEMTILFD